MDFGGVSPAASRNVGAISVRSTKSQKTGKLFSSTQSMLENKMRVSGSKSPSISTSANVSPVIPDSMVNTKALGNST